MFLRAGRFALNYNQPIAMTTTITSTAQAEHLLNIYGTFEANVQGIEDLPEDIQLKLHKLDHQPIWETMGREAFNKYKINLIDSTRRVMRHAEDAYIDMIKGMFDNISSMDEQILRESFYIKTPEYRMLGKGMQQVAYLCAAMVPAISPTAARSQYHREDLKPANN